MTESDLNKPRLKCGSKDLPVEYKYSLYMGIRVSSSVVHFYDHSVDTLFSSIRA